MLAPSFYLSVIEDNENYEKFMLLYSTYEKKIFNIAYGLTENFHYAEEASQSALFALARNIEKIDLDDEMKAKVYIYKTVKSTSLDILRKKSKTVKTVSINNFFDLSYENEVNTELESDENCKAIVEVIISMPEAYRDVLSMYYLGNFSTREIADMLSRPLTTVKSQLARGNKILIEKLVELRIYD